MNSSSQLFLLLLLIGSMSSCVSKKNTNESNEESKVQKINSSYFITDQGVTHLDTVDCTLSNGVKSKCLQITTNSIPTDHEVGPWCPETISGTDAEGGIWFNDGEIHAVDGDFIHNLAVFYDDERWLLYDEDGHVIKTNSKEDCMKLANAQLVDEFTNYCIECLPEYVSNLSKTYIIPIQPIILDTPTMLGGPPKGRPDAGGNRPSGPPPGGKRGGGGPAARGIAFNGVVFDAPAPIPLILSGYTIPPLDHAGGHINMDAGYHYHAATGVTKEIEQQDGHAPMIGYALDGIGLYANQNVDSSTSNDLDQCRGHYDEERGYHYHVDEAGNNNFINCFSGATASTN